MGLLSTGAKNGSAAKSKTTSAPNTSHKSARRERRGKKTNDLPRELHDEHEPESSYLDSRYSSELDTATSNSMASPSPVYSIPPPADEMELSFFQNLVDFDVPLFSPSAEGQGLIHVSHGDLLALSTSRLDSSLT